MKRPFVVMMSSLVLMPVVAVGVLSLTNSFRVKDLLILGDIPPFQVTERSGKPVSRESLKGKVWVASFIFTRCSGQCPLLCQELKKIQSRLRFKESFRLVSFSVDPERDTPEVLAEYATRFSADPYKWWFVTGDKKEMNALVRHGFRLSSGDPGDPSAGEEEVIHSFKLVLVDGYGRIRGYYDGTDEGSLKSLVKDAKYLIRQTF